jgi:hypothetical protein
MSPPESLPSPRAAGSRRAPVIALLVLAPVVAEVLYGATRISVLFVLLPEIMVWGCGALLIREAVRGGRRGWGSLLLLGLALAVAEECVIQQTSVAPLVGLARHAYGRVGGVNWVYLLWALGYESVWVVLVPVGLVELLFPGRRGEPWLRPRGRVIAAAVFCLGSFLAWYSWTQRARVQVFHMAPYSLPAPILLGSLGVIAALVAAAFAGRAAPPAAAVVPGRPAPPPLRVGLAAAVFGLPWGAMVLLGYGDAPGVPFGWVLAGSLAWAGLAGALFGRWSARPGWSDGHRYAAVVGAIAACMLAGFVVFLGGGAKPVDWIGKLILNLAATAWLAALGRKVWRRRPRQGVA